MGFKHWMDIGFKKVDLTSEQNFIFLKFFACGSFHCNSPRASRFMAIVLTSLRLLQNACK